jgi:DNA repair protein RecN (Recombination protein N)
MLSELVIENLALFQRATLAFGPGLDVITGETGAGKSLLIGALELLLGERSRSVLVRKGAEEARVEGRFVLSKELADAPDVRAFFDESLPAVPEEWSQLDDADERELVLARTLSAAGKTRAWVNHRPVTQRLLKELAGKLVEIHGQNEHQRLLDPAEQTRLLDAFGGNETALGRYRDARSTWSNAANEVAAFERAARERRERADLLRHQARELAAARVGDGEHDDLQHERARLRYANDLAREVGGSLADLAGEEGGAGDVLRRALRVLEHWQERVPELGSHADELRQSLVHFDEAAAGLEAFLARVEASPERLEQVESRLFEIESLQKKYRTDAAGLSARRSAIEVELAAIDTEERDLEALLRARDQARKAVVEAAAELTRRRKACTAKLQKAVKASLTDLGLERGVFVVRIDARTDSGVKTAPESKTASDPKTTSDPRTPPDASTPSSGTSQRKVGATSPNDDDAKSAVVADERRFGADGADAIEFLLAANPGEDMQPMRQVASGGETARIMLALRTALAVKQTIPTLVFDEIDAGVGGRLGPKVGEHLRLLSERHQILCVTHLPAIAALAHRHFKVTKAVAGGRTTTGVVELTGDARVEEVADMIAGGAAHATARAEAKRLLAQA